MTERLEFGTHSSGRAKTKNRALPIHTVRTYVGYSKASQSWREGHVCPRLLIITRSKYEHVYIIYSD
jgi:hypothetical protein